MKLPKEIYAYVDEDADQEECEIAHGKGKKCDCFEGDLVQTTSDPKRLPNNTLIGIYKLSGMGKMNRTFVRDRSKR